jgi:hypothetical protein
MRLVRSIAVALVSVLAAGCSDATAPPIRVTALYILERTRTVFCGKHIGEITGSTLTLSEAVLDAPVYLYSLAVTG